MPQIEMIRVHSDNLGPQIGMVQLKGALYGVRIRRSTAISVPETKIQMRFEKSSQIPEITRHRAADTNFCTFGEAANVRVVFVNCRRHVMLRVAFN